MTKLADGDTGQDDSESGKGRSRQALVERNHAEHYAPAGDEVVDDGEEGRSRAGHDLEIEDAGNAGCKQAE